jgi:bla regulator protein blaR1
MPPGGSGFLQALGWATLNSFWQMGLLWSAWLLINHYFKLSSNRKYITAVVMVFTGTAWFLFSLISFYINGFNNGSFIVSQKILNNGMPGRILTSASITYLALLIIPTYKVFLNWRFLQTIRKNAAQKAPLKNRLFVEKISGLLGIKTQVKVFLSELVTSPVTIGYLKPMILLPVAVLTQLNPQQIEAILIHELTHIRRHDYLLNLFLTAIRVLLYFNPFIRFFLSAIEAERENCCDELVLQFEYDNVSYASALLQLEKNNHVTTDLAMGATSQKHLLNRIEKIVGVNRKKKMNLNHFAGAFIALILLFTINSLIIAGKEKLTATQDAFGFSQPVSYLPSSFNATKNDNAPVTTKASALIALNTKESSADKPAPLILPPPIPEVPADVHYVSLDEVDASLTHEQKEQVKKTLVSTKSILRSKWNDVENNMADGMNDAEKLVAKDQYLTEIENINWPQIEKNMKAGYDNMDWTRINAALSQQAAAASLDSIKQNYIAALIELEAAKTNSASSQTLPVPDASIRQINKLKKELEARIREISTRERKVIRL